MGFYVRMARMNSLRQHSETGSVDVRSTNVFDLILGFLNDFRGRVDNIPHPGYEDVEDVSKGARGGLKELFSPGR